MSSSQTKTEEEHQPLVLSRTAAAASRGGDGAVSQEAPRLCLVFRDSFLGGQKSEWLRRLRAAGFQIEQASATLVAVTAPEEMLAAVAAQRGSQGAAAVPATRERVLHLLLTDFDPALRALLRVPGPFRHGRRRALPAAPEGDEMGGQLQDWFWLHNGETVKALAPSGPWSGCFGLSRQPLAPLREYFGSEVAWDMLWLNFLARWTFVPAVGSLVYTYAIALSFVQTGSFDSPFLPIAGGVLMVWGAAMLFFWVRLSDRYGARWREEVRITGRDGLNADATLDEVVDEELGEVRYAYPEWKHRLKRLAAILFLILPAAAVAAVAAGTLDARARIVEMEAFPRGALFAGLAAAAALFVVVRMVAFPWSRVMTHWENYTHRAGFQYALGARCFWFEAGAHLAPLLYMALVNAPLLSRFPPSGNDTVVDALVLQASVIFLAWWLAAAAITSLQQHRYAVAARRASGDGPLEGPDFSSEEQARRPPPPDTLWSNAWLSLQLVYAFVLGAICPLAPALLHAWVMQRLHWRRTSLLYTFRRGHPHAAPAPGFWGDGLQAVAVLALAVNIPLVLICSRMLSVWFPDVTLEERWGFLALGEVATAALATFLLARSLRPPPPDPDHE